MPPTHYDVFISRKSQDAHLAKELYDFLTSKGLKVFDSDHSLQEMGNADYSRAIDEALVNTEHLIVVGSSVENINSSWVEAEWRFFLNRKRSGKAKGNLLTILTNTLKIDELPPSLQNYECIFLHDGNMEKIYHYVKKTESKEIFPPISNDIIYTGISKNFDSNNSQILTELQNLIYELINFHSNPEGIYYIGSILLRCEDLFLRHFKTDYIIPTINELIEDLDSNHRTKMGNFDPKLSIKKIIKLRRYLYDLCIKIDKNYPYEKVKESLNHETILHELTQFNSNPEAIYYIGQLIVKSDYIFQLYGYPDNSFQVTNEVIEEIDYADGFLSDPKISLNKIRHIKRIIESIR